MPCPLDAGDRFDREALRGRLSDVAPWLGRVTDRHVFVSPDETLVWFDERLESSLLGSSGPLHASGVLRRERTWFFCHRYWLRKAQLGLVHVHR